MTNGSQQLSDQQPVGEVHVLIGAVPTGDYSQVRQLLKEGKQRNAFPIAFRRASEALVGLIRGRVHDQVQWARYIVRNTPLENETKRLFFEVDAVERALRADPVAAFDSAFAYFEQLPRRFSIVVPARVLLGELRWYIAGLADLPYGDLSKEADDLEHVLLRATQNPNDVSPNIVRNVEERLSDLRQREHSVRALLDAANQQGKRAPVTSQERRRPRREYDEDWRRRLRFEPEEAVA